MRSKHKTRRHAFLAFLSACLLICITLGTQLTPLQASADSSAKTLIPGGMAFGVKYYAKGAIVIGICDVETASGLESPAKKAGLQAGDVITAVGGKEIERLEELLELVQQSGGKQISLQILRDGQSKSVVVLPAAERNSKLFRLGAWVRDSTAGIGTITFVDAKTGEFGGLGHGINDSATGLLMPFGSGSIVDVTITGITKGIKSVPGELKGEFGQTELGKLSSNTEVGVFGRFNSVPSGLGAPVPVATAGELQAGKATVRTAVDGTIRDYEIEIEEIYKNSGKTKNFLIHVTDQALLSKTGGIVQGMSGSPILQNGKLVGAVTHVLVNDPTRGFGILIGNMLEELEA